LLAFLAALSARAEVLLSQEEALAKAFPGAAVERRTLFLDQDQVEQVRKLAGTEPPSRVVTCYRGLRDGRTVGTAYFETHRVRTLPEVLMVLVDGEGRVKTVEVLSFQEPRDYLPRERWFEQFRGRPLDEGLSLKRGIRGITGATLSGRAVTASVRRILALHQVLEAVPGGTAGREAGPEAEKP
jgi:hypothetical protein